MILSYHTLPLNTLIEYTLIVTKQCMQVHYYFHYNYIVWKTSSHDNIHSVHIFPHTSPNIIIILSNISTVVFYIPQGIAEPMLYFYNHRALVFSSWIWTNSSSVTAKYSAAKARARTRGAARLFISVICGSLCVAAGALLSRSFNETYRHRASRRVLKKFSR